MLHRQRLVFISVVLIVSFCLPIFTQAQDCIPTDITRVSVASDGTQGNDTSYSRSLSGDGRFVVFVSYADNLVPDDTNDESDVFVYDRENQETTRVSVASNGAQANGSSNYPTISADGRFVAFVSGANNLVAGDTGFYDIFVHDRQTGATTRVSVASDGTPANHFSSDPTISADGRFVTFVSEASNLVAEDTNNFCLGNNGFTANCPDIFVHDQQTGETTLVSAASDGTQANDASQYPTISGDGRLVAFNSYATNLVANDTNNTSDIFVHDRQTGQTTRVSVASNGTQGNDLSIPSIISADGRFVAFSSLANTLVSGDTNNTADVFVHELQIGVTTRVSVASDGTQGNGGDPSLSGDGRFVVFISDAIHYDAKPAADLFVHDRQTQETLRVLTNTGGQLDNSPAYPDISADGRFIAFMSSASNLVPNDTNGVADVFVVNRDTCQISSNRPAPQRNAFHNSIILTWNPVSWATKYHIQVDTDTAFQFPFTVNNDLLTADTLSLPLSDLGRTTYYWRVRAQKPDGSWGGWSAVETFVIW